MHVADLRRKGDLPAAKPARFCTVHRHVRAQEIKGGKGFTAHFKIGCLVSTGRDLGDHRWECQALREMMQAFQSLFKEVFKVEEIRWKLQQRGGYEGVQFKMIIDLAGRECEIADGG